MRENCLAEFEKHWNCLEWNNQVRLSPTQRTAYCISLTLCRNINTAENPSGR